MSALNNQILAAFSTNDKEALAELYSQAARTASTLDSACFFATQAYIFALECNHDIRADLLDFLKQHGREE